MLTKEISHELHGYSGEAAEIHRPLGGCVDWTAISDPTGQQSRTFREIQSAGLKFQVNFTLHFYVPYELYISN